MSTIEIKKIFRSKSKNGSFELSSQTWLNTRSVPISFLIFSYYSLDYSGTVTHSLVALAVGVKWSNWASRRSGFRGVEMLRTEKLIDVTLLVATEHQMTLGTCSVILHSTRFPLIESPSTALFYWWYRKSIISELWRWIYIFKKVNFCKCSTFRLS